MDLEEAMNISVPPIPLKIPRHYVNIEDSHWQQSMMPLISSI